MQIDDGTGQGFKAKVDDEQRLHVQSKARPSEEVEAEQGDAFILHGECHLAAAAAGGLMAFENTGTQEFVVTRIYIDPHVLTPTDLIVTQVKDPTVSGGTATPTGKVQKNYRSGKALDGTLTISDGSADIAAFSDGEQYHAFPVQSMTPQQRDMKGTNVIPPGKTIAWGWKTRGGGNATNAEVIALSVNGFLRDVA